MTTQAPGPSPAATQPEARNPRPLLASAVFPVPPQRDPALVAVHAARSAAETAHTGRRWLVAADLLHPDERVALPVAEARLAAAVPALEAVQRAEAAAAGALLPPRPSDTTSRPLSALAERAAWFGSTLQLPN